MNRTIMSDMPIPENFDALLVPDLRDGAGNLLRTAPTPHRYDHTEERHALAVSDTLYVEDISYVHIFRCTVTGALRTYGCEGPNSPNLTEEI